MTKEKEKEERTFQTKEAKFASENTTREKELEKLRREEAGYIATMSNFAKNTPDHKNAKKALNTSQARAKKLTGEKNTAENDLRNIRSNIERFVATLETLEEFMDSEYESNDKLKAAQLEFEESEKRHAEAKAEADSAQDERRQYDKAVKDADKQIKNASRSAEKHTKKLTKAQSNQEKARLLTKVQKKRTEAAYWKVDEAAYRREVKECNKMRDERADLIDQVDQDTAAVETKRNALPYELGASLPWSTCRGRHATRF